MTKESKAMKRTPVAKVIPLASLAPHPLNANVMAPELREKLLAHIRGSGKYPALIVRPHPEDPEKYQILDGHHRAAVLRDLGHTEARCDVWEVDDREAKLLLATLNRLEGQDAPIRRAELIHQLLGEMSMEDLAGLLPETDKEIRELQDLLTFPADDIAAEIEAQTAEAEKTLPRVLYFVVTPEQEAVINEAIEAASDGTAGKDRKARGLFNLATHFMESAQPQPGVEVDA